MPVLTLAFPQAIQTCDFNNKKYNIIPNLFPKSCDFYTIRNVGMSNDCMLSFTFYIDLLLKKKEYL